MIRTSSLAALMAVAILATAGSASAGPDPGKPSNPSTPAAKQTPSPATPEIPVIILQGGIPGPTLRQQLSGTVRVTDCAATTSNITVRVDGRVIPVVADDQGLTFRYRQDGIVPGPHTVAVNLESGMCPGGVWTPATRTVTISPGGTVDDADFSFGFPHETRTLSRGVIRTIGGAVFSGFRMHLNNHDPIVPPWHESYFRSGDSFLQFNAASAPVPFDVAETDIAYGTGRAKYYVNNVNSVDPTRLDYDGERLKISVALRGDGSPEILGHQMGAVFSPPNVRLTNAHLDLYLHPIRDLRGRVTYDYAKADFIATITGEGVLGTFADMFMPSYHRQIASGVETQVVAFLSRDDTREMITQTLQAQLASIHIGYINSLRTTPEGVVLDYRPST